MAEERTPEARSAEREKSESWNRNRIKRIAKRIVAEEVARSIDTSLPRALERIGYSGEIAGLVHLLAAKSNDAKDEVLRKALTLYGLALDELEKGNRLVVVSPDDTIVHDIIGIGPVEPSLARSSG